MERHIVIRDAWGRTMAHCTGPTADGHCPRVGTGELVACAGRVIASEMDGGSIPFRVREDELTCPVTGALALAGSPDS